MIKTINPAPIKGVVNAPASKSMLQRAIISASLSKGTSILRNITWCDDSTAVLDIATSFGAQIEKKGHDLIITGNVNLQVNEFNCGESGLASRMLIPIASLLNHEIKITGKKTLLTRPFSIIEKGLSSLGVECISQNGYLPIVVKGPLKGGTIEIDGSMSSQFITGLLMALPLASNDSVLKVRDINSKPYIDLTIDVLKQFGIIITHKNYTVFKIKGNQQYQPTEIKIEGDWSGAAFFLVAGAIAGDITVKGLNIESLQADKAVLNALIKAGADVQINNSEIKVTKSELKAFSFDATDCPDLFPPLAVLAAASKGISEIIGVDRLINKETNRALALTNEFTKAGIGTHIRNNKLLIIGGTIRGTNINSYNDHRMAMAAALAGLIADGAINIEQYRCVSKSYPEFFETLKKLLL